MQDEHYKQLVLKVINKDKWWDMLSRFIEVLRINIFIVDAKGRIVLPPEEAKYGGRLLASNELGFDLLENSKCNIENFEEQGTYLEAQNRYGLNSFALPVKVSSEEAVAYMIVGPVILNRRLDAAQYEEMAESYGVKTQVYMDEINGIRALSNVMMNSILDLLKEIVKDSVELTLKEIKKDEAKELPPKNINQQKVEEVAQEIYSTVRLDELLVTLLDVALKMTKTECGSIMVVDEKSGELIVKASKGIDSENAAKAHIKLGDGIAGLAAQENESFLINGQQGDNRISHLLKRPEIKQALVMPLMARDRVFGVLNLHTQKEESKIEDNINNLQYLSNLLSSAF